MPGSGERGVHSARLDRVGLPEDERATPQGVRHDTGRHGLPHVAPLRQGAGPADGVFELRFRPPGVSPICRSNEIDVA